MLTCPECQTQMEDDARFCPSCGHQMADMEGSAAAMAETIGGLETVDDAPTEISNSSTMPDLETGSTFADRYTIEDVIGRGGMGVVYRAHDILAKKTVALKLIRPERLAGTNAVDRLISEGILTRDIRHPNVIAVYDVSSQSGKPFVSMEYLEGETLRSWHRKKAAAREAIPLRVAARIVLEILEGLKAAHEAGVIHRDLKPENIILTDEPNDKQAPLKILDFGIAIAPKAVKGGGTGTRLGTPKYMAPEQITNPDIAGPSADLYSLSVLFYELLMDVIPETWQPPSGGRSDIPHGIDGLIEKGLSNRPANRQQSAAEYRQEVVDAVNKRTPPPPPPPPPPPADVTKWLKWGGIGFAGFVVLGVIGMMLPDDPVEPCAGLSGADYRACMGWDDDVTPTPTPTPTPTSNSSIYSALGGEWDDGLGTVYNINMNRSGRFTGSGYSVDGTRLQLSGSLSGSSGSYTVSAPSMGVSLNGRLQWDRGCHISFQTFDPSGSMILEQGQMHVNHAPGDPCP